MKINLKRITALILTLTLVIPCVFAADSVTTVSETVSEEYRLLKGLGIFYGFESKKMSDSVTRGEMAQLVSTLCGIESDGKQYFTDVTSQNECFDAVSILSQAGVLSKSDDGNFYKDRIVTLNEAAKILVSILGYSQIAESKEGYPYAYIAFARQLKISTSQQGEYLTFGEIVNMIADAIEANPLETTSVDSKGQMGFTQSNEILIKQKLDISLGMGIVEKTKKSSLWDKSDKTAKNRVVVGGKEYHCGEFTDIESYIGYKVKYYYDKDNSIVYAYIPDNFNRTKTVNVSDVVSYNKTTKKLSYEENGNQKEIEVPVDSNILVNDCAFSGTVSESLFKPETGTITFIDNDNSSGYDVIDISAYSTYVVKSLNTSRKLITDKSGVLPQLDLSGSNIEYKIVYDGIELGFEDIPAGGVINIAADRFTTKTVDGVSLNVIDTANSEFYEIIISSVPKISGNITEIKDDTVTLDGNEYKMTKTLHTLINLPNGSVVEKPDFSKRQAVYLNSFGEIAYFETDSASDTYSYGWLMGLQSVDVFSSTWYIRYLDTLGEIYEKKIAPKVKITADWSNTGSPYSVTTKSVDAENLDSVSQLISNGSYVRQLIKYELNENDEVSGIKIAVKRNSNYKYWDYEGIFTLSEAYDNGRKISYGNASDYSLGSMFEMPRANGEFTVPAFYIPNSDAAPDDGYYMRTESFKGSQAYTDLYLYDVDKKGLVGAYVEHYDYTPLTSNPTGTEVGYSAYPYMTVIDKVYTGYDTSEEEAVTYIEGYQNGNRVKYRAVNENLVSNDLGASNPYSKIPFKDLKPGDIMAVNVNHKKQVTGFRMFFHNITKLQNGDFVREEYVMGGGSAAGMETYVGYCHWFSGYVLTSDSGKGFVQVGNYDRRFYNPAKVYIYDSQQETYTVSNVGNVKAGDFVFVYNGYGVTKGLVVIR